MGGSQRSHACPSGLTEDDLRTGPTLLTFRAGTVWGVSSNYISLDQAAERLGVNPRTIRGYIVARDLPTSALVST